MWQAAKLLIAASVIACASSLAERAPRLAGFLIALPLSSMLALLLFQVEYRDKAKAVAFAKSIVLAIPLSLLFFVPFLLADRLRWPFWGLYASGVALLAVAYAVHSVWLQ